MADYKSFDDYFDYALDKRFPEVKKPSSVPAPGMIDKIVTEGLGALQSNIENKPAESVYALGKGAAEGVVGMPGDIISLIRGVIDVATSPEGASKLEAFIGGLDKPTGLPTTEDVRGVTEKVLPKTSATAAQTAGEILAPIGTAIKGTKTIAKAAKSTMKAK